MLRRAGGSALATRAQRKVVGPTERVARARTLRRPGSGAVEGVGLKLVRFTDLRERRPATRVLPEAPERSDTTLGRPRPRAETSMIRTTPVS